MAVKELYDWAKNNDVLDLQLYFVTADDHNKHDKQIVYKAEVVKDCITFAGDDIPMYEYVALG